MEFIQSPNYNKGRNGQKPELIVIHIMDGTYEGSIAWFKNPASDVSSHYLISKEGEMTQMVNEADTAWTNGRVDRPTSKIVKSKPGVNPNFYSLTIEHEGKPTDKWTEAMKKQSAELIAHFAKRWDIPLDRDHVIGHYEIYAAKPNCPATSKAIINELITLAKQINEPPVEDPEQPMTKELRKAYIRLVGEDPQEKMNENEEKKLAKAINELMDKPTPAPSPVTVTQELKESMFFAHGIEINDLGTDTQKLIAEREKTLKQSEVTALDKIAGVRSLVA